MLSKRAIRMLTFMLIVSAPLYASRQQPARPASTAAQHKADLKALLESQEDQYIVQGQGIPRVDLPQCERELAEFSKSLKSKNLVPLEAATCNPVEGQTDTFAPTFRALSRNEVVAELLSGGRFNSLSFCEVEAQRMSGTTALSGRVLETTCRRVTTGNTNDEVYEPTLLVLNAPKIAGTVKKYSSLETLDAAAGKAAVKAMASADGSLSAAKGADHL